MSSPHRVLLMRGRGFISSSIRVATRSIWSHCAFWDGNTNTKIEAWQGSGVVERPNTDWTDIDVFTLEGATTEQWQIILDHARNTLGAGYDYAGVMAFITKARITDQVIPQWFCSSLVQYCCARAGIPLQERVSYREVSPHMIGISTRLNLSGPIKVNQ